MTCEDNDLYGGIGGLIALKPCGARSLVPNKALFALQHQDRPVDQVEVVPGQSYSYSVHFLKRFIIIIRRSVAILAALVDSVNVGEEMSGLLRADKLPVVCLEGDGPVLQPVEVEQGCVGSPSLSCLEATSGLQTEQQKLKEYSNRVQLYFRGMFVINLWC